MESFRLLVSVSFGGCSGDTGHKRRTCVLRRKLTDLFDVFAGLVSMGVLDAKVLLALDQPRQWVLHHQALLQANLKRSQEAPGCPARPVASPSLLLTLAIVGATPVGSQSERLQSPVPTSPLHRRFEKINPQPSTLHLINPTKTHQAL